jgi:MoaA/NifB/PqqE/SkfB family radical SAM enzyme
MTREEVAGHVQDALALGVREFYFTGGEPFMHPDMMAILGDTLRLGPCSVLTNGTLFTERRLRELKALTEASIHALEIRVSLDGPTAPEHDLLRGQGSFEKTLDGLRAASAAGLLPIVTVTQQHEEDPIEFREHYLQMLRDAGIVRPRLKVLPMFLLGREADRSRPYAEIESLAGLGKKAFDPERLQCSGCRAVTAKGAYVCPLLVDEPGGRMGDRLGDALGDFELRHGACYTCYVTGMTCSNA